MEENVHRCVMDEERGGILAFGKGEPTQSIEWNLSNHVMGAHFRPYKDCMSLHTSVDEAKRP